MRAQPAKLQGSHAGAVAHYAASPYRTAGARHLTADTEAFYTAKTYDPEQHAYPNQVRSGASAALPGSTHPLVFEDDETGPYVYLPGDSGQYVYCADPGTLGTDDLDLIARIYIADVTPAGDWAIMTKWDTTSNNREWRLDWDTTGTLNFYFSTTGVNQPGTTSSTTISTTGWLWVRAWFDNDNSIVRFYTSTETVTEAADVTWTQLGSDRVLTGGTFYNASSQVEIGSLNVGAANNFEGRVQRGLVYQGAHDAGGTLLADFNASLFTPGNRGHGATADDAQGNTWTVSRAGSPLSVIDDGDGNGKRVRFQSVSGNYCATADRAALELSAADVLQIDLELTAEDWTPGSAYTFVGKYLTTGNQRSWRLDLLTGGNLRLWVSTNGIATASAASSIMGLTNASKYFIRLIWTVGTGYSLATSTDGETYSTVDASVALTEVPFDSSADLIVGGFSNGASQSPTVDVHDVALTLNGVEVSNFDPSKVNRHQWRIENTVDSDVAGETWTVAYTDSAEDANDPVINSAGTTATHTGTHWVDIPHDAAIDLGSGEGLSAAIRMQFATGGGASERFVSKQNTSDDGWAILRNASTPAAYGRADDGTNIPAVGDNGDNVSYDTDFVAVAAFKASDSEFYIDGSSVETDSSTTLGDAGVAEVLRVGARPDDSSPATMVWKSLVVLSKRVSDAEALAISNELANA